MPKITWEVELREKVSGTLTEMSKTAVGAAASGAAGFTEFTNRLNLTDSAAVRLKQTIKDDSNSFTQARDSANAMAAQARQAGAEASALKSQILAVAAANKEAERQAAAFAKAQTTAATALKESSSSSSGGGGFLGDLLKSQIILQGLQAVGGAITSTAEKALTLTSDLEQAKVAFTGLDGSAAAADAELTKLRAFSDKTPFRFAEVRQYAVELQGVGVAADKVIPVLTDVGNIVSGTGGGAQQLKEVALAYEQIQSKGKLQGQEALQLENARIPVWQLLAATMHKSTAELQAMSAAGEITAQTFDAAFHNYAVAQFGGAMEKQSHTLGGLASTAQDLGDKLLTAFGGAAVQASGLEPKAEHLIALLSDPKVEAWIADVGTGLGTIAGALLDAAGSAASFIGTLTGMPPTVAAVQSGFQGAAEAAATIAPALAEGEAVAERQKRIVGDLQDSLSGLRDQASAVGLSYDKMIDPLREQERLLQRAWQLEDKQAEVAKLQKDIAKDRALAVDAYSSVGQEAARRLPDEELRLSTLQRGIQRDGIKARLDDQISGLEAQKKAREEDFRHQEALLEKQIKLIQASAKTTETAGAATTAAIAATVGQLNTVAKTVQGALGAFMPGGTTTTGVTGGLTGISAAIKTMAGPEVLGALKASWRDLTSIWDQAPATLNPLGDNLDKLINALGGRDGMAGAATVAGFEFERLMKSLAIAGPPVLENIGHQLQITGDQASQLAAGLRMTLEITKLMGDPGNADQRARARDAYSDFGKATQQIATDNASWAARNKELSQDWRDRIASLNKDVDTRKEAALTTLDGRQTRTGGSFGAVEAPLAGGGGRGAAGIGDTVIRLLLTVDQDGMLTLVQRQVQSAVQSTQTVQLLVNKLGRMTP